MINLQTKLQQEYERLFGEIDFNAELPIEEPVYACNVCYDRGWFIFDVPQGHALFGKAQDCDNPDCAAGQERIARRMKNYDMPKRYRELTFERWEALPDEQKKGKFAAYFAALAFVEQPEHMVKLSSVLKAQRINKWEEFSDEAKNSLVFYGPMGVGKTGLCAAVMNRLSAQGYQGILYRRTSDLMQDLQDAFNDKDKASEAGEMSFLARIGRYKNAKILMLDEWNIENVTDFRRQSMEDIIRHRHGRDLPTLITTNLTKEQAYTHWSERTADVLAEMAHWVPVGGVKLRKG